MLCTKSLVEFVLSDTLNTSRVFVEISKQNQCYFQKEFDKLKSNSKYMFIFSGDMVSGQEYASNTKPKKVEIMSLGEGKCYEQFKKTYFSAYRWGLLSKYFSRTLTEPQFVPVQVFPNASINAG